MAWPEPMDEIRLERGDDEDEDDDVVCEFSDVDVLTVALTPSFLRIVFTEF